MSIEHCSAAEMIISRPDAKSLNPSAINQRRFGSWCVDTWAVNRIYER